MMGQHGDKIKAAIRNPKLVVDHELLLGLLGHYERWLDQLYLAESLDDKVTLLNEYKDHLDLDVIMGRGSQVFRRQAGQLKLSSSLVEEFFEIVIRQVTPSDLRVGQIATTVVAGVVWDGAIPNLDLITKDQDLAIVRDATYTISSGAASGGPLAIPVMVAEIKQNLDKNMFRECCHNAAQLKQGDPRTVCLVITEFLDMTPMDLNRTALDGVYILRRANRPSVGKRDDAQWLRSHRAEHPIDNAVVKSIISHVEHVFDSSGHSLRDACASGGWWR